MSDKHFTNRPPTNRPLTNRADRSPATFRRLGRGRFFWKLFAGNALLLIVVVGCCLALIIGAFNRFYRDDLSRQLKSQAQIIRHQAQIYFQSGQKDKLDALANALAQGQPQTIRITFIDAGGTVLGDSNADAEQMENHAQRTEVHQALAHGSGESTRFSNTVKQDLKYVALTVGDPPIGIVRVAMPVENIVAQTQAAGALFLSVASIVLAAAVALALGLALLWSRRIAIVTTTARSLSRGDLSARAPVGGSDEVGLLARSLNRMGRSLEDKISTIDRQRRMLEHLLSQLQEGVIVLDHHGGVVLTNPAAAKLLTRLKAEASSPARSDLRSAADLPNDLQWMIRGSGSPERVHQTTISGDDRQTTLLVRAADITLPQIGDVSDVGDQRGRILVLTDVTELAHTVQVKADFVANASHELRTPLTAIRAAVETLANLSDSTDSDRQASSRNLVEIIDRHSERLGAIVGDLLDLARLESPQARFEPRTESMTDVVTELHERFAARLTEKRVNWRLSPDDRDEILVNRQLLTLVLDNLVDNAIKFTPEGGSITLGWSWVDDDVSIVVADTGCGMATQEQERVFERFYQVERARSGVRRGTGLGLSIVRHAVNAMNGDVELASELDHGTKVRVHLRQPGAIT